MTSLSDQKRVFMAVPVLKNLFSALRDQLSFCAKELPSGYWVLPEKAHMTLHFFGNVSADTLYLFWKDLSGTIKKEFRSFSTDITHIAFFPFEHSHLIVAWVFNSTMLQKLFDRTKMICHQHHLPLNRDKFLPHITLYRCYDVSFLKMPKISLTQHHLMIDRLMLYESNLNEKESPYHVLDDIQLS